MPIVQLFYIILCMWHMWNMFTVLVSYENKDINIHIKGHLELLYYPLKYIQFYNVAL